MELAAILKKIDRHLWDLWRELGQQSGSMELTVSETDYLWTLVDNNGMRLTEFAEAMKVSKASASVMVAKLEKRGYIARTPCTEDGRAMRLIVTAKTQSLSDEGMNVYRRGAVDLEKNLSSKELDQLTKLLNKAYQT